MSIVYRDVPLDYVLGQQVVVLWNNFRYPFDSFTYSLPNVYRLSSNKPSTLRIANNSNNNLSMEMMRPTVPGDFVEITLFINDSPRAIYKCTLTVADVVLSGLVGERVRYAASSETVQVTLFSSSNPSVIEVVVDDEGFICFETRGPGEAQVTKQLSATVTYMTGKYVVVEHKFSLTLVAGFREIARGTGTGIFRSVDLSSVDQSAVIVFESSNPAAICIVETAAASVDSSLPSTPHSWLEFRNPGVATVSMKVGGITYVGATYTLTAQRIPLQCNVGNRTLLYTKSPSPGAFEEVGFKQIHLDTNDSTPVSFASSNPNVLRILNPEVGSGNISMETIGPGESVVTVHTDGVTYTAGTYVVENRKQLDFETGSRVLFFDGNAFFNEFITMMPIENETPVCTSTNNNVMRIVSDDSGSIYGEMVATGNATITVKGSDTSTVELKFTYTLVAVLEVTVYHRVAARQVLFSESSVNGGFKGEFDSNVATDNPNPDFISSDEAVLGIVVQTDQDGAREICIEMRRTGVAAITLVLNRVDYVKCVYTSAEDINGEVYESVVGRTVSLCRGNILEGDFAGIAWTGDVGTVPVFVSSDENVLGIVIDDGGDTEEQVPIRRAFMEIRLPGKATIRITVNGVTFVSRIYEVVSATTLSRKLDCAIGRKILLNTDQLSYFGDFRNTRSQYLPTFISSDETVLSIYKNTTSGTPQMTFDAYVNEREGDYGIFAVIRGPGTASVIMKANNEYVTGYTYVVESPVQSSLRPLPQFTDGTIFYVASQAALEQTLVAAKDGNVIELAAGEDFTFYNSLNVTAKRLWIRGASREGCVIRPHVYSSEANVIISPLITFKGAMGQIVLSNLTIISNGPLGVMLEGDNEYYIVDCNFEGKYTHIESVAGQLQVSGCKFTSTYSRRTTAETLGYSLIRITNARGVCIIQDNIFADTFGENSDLFLNKPIMFHATQTLMLSEVVIKSNSSIGGTRMVVPVAETAAMLVPVTPEDLNPFVDFYNVSFIDFYNGGGITSKLLRLFLIGNQAHEAHSSLCRIHQNEPLQNFSLIVARDNTFEPTPTHGKGLISLDATKNDTNPPTIKKSAIVICSGNSSVSDDCQMYVDAVWPQTYGRNTIAYRNHSFLVFSPFRVYNELLKQTITFSDMIPAEIVQGVPTVADTVVYSASKSITLRATCDIGGTSNVITFASSDLKVATVVGSRLTLRGTGTAVITASVSGSALYAATNAKRTLRVLKGAQTITFALASSMVYTPTWITLTGTSDSSLPVLYSSTNPLVAEIRGNTLRLVREGVVIITATQYGDANYWPAIDVRRSLTVTRKAQILTFTLPERIAYTPAGELLNGTSDSNLPVTYSVTGSGRAEVQGDRLVMLSEGAVYVTAMQGGNRSYQAASEVSRQSILVKKEQSVTFTFAADIVTYTANLAVPLNGVSDRGLEVRYGVSNTTIADIVYPTTLGSDTLPMLVFAQEGSVDVTVFQSGSNVYMGAESVTRRLIANTKTMQSISGLVLPSSILFLGADANQTVALSAVASSNLPVTYKCSDERIATVSGSVLTVLGIGTVQITASQVGDTTFNPAVVLTRTLVIGPREVPTLRFNLIGLLKYSANLKLPLFALASSGMPVRYMSSNTSVVVIKDSTAEIIGVGETVITASVLGNGNFGPISQSRTLIVEKDESKTLIYGIAGGVGGLLLLVAAGFVVFKMKKKPDGADDDGGGNNN